MTVNQMLITFSHEGNPSCQKGLAEEKDWTGEGAAGHPRYLVCCRHGDRSCRLHGKRWRGWCVLMEVQTRGRLHHCGVCSRRSTFVKIENFIFCKSFVSSDKCQGSGQDWRPIIPFLWWKFIFLFSC